MKRNYLHAAVDVKINYLHPAVDMRRNYLDENVHAHIEDGCSLNVIPQGAEKF